MVNAFFWHWFWALKDRAVSAGVMKAVEYIKKNWVECPPSGGDTTNPGPACSTWRAIMAIVTLATTIPDTINVISGLFDFSSSNQTVEEQQEEIEQGIDEEIQSQLGTTPY